MTKVEDVYGEYETFIYKNIVAQVRSPILTEEERNRRMECIKQAVIQLFTNNVEVAE